MNNIQKWLIVTAALIASIGILLNGRYQFCPGQDLGGPGGLYEPRIIDTWTGAWRHL